MILLSPDMWTIQTTRDNGRGIFAKKDIKPGTVIGDYIGRVIDNANDDTREKEGLYLMYYNDLTSIYPIDINAPGIHLMNHSCMPNCWLYTYKGHTLFFTLRTVFAGEELTTDYLLSPDDYCDPCLHQCHCKTPFCRGTMHLKEKDFQTWNNFHEEQGKETKRLPVRYGSMLKPLRTYPTTISDHPIYNLFGAQSKKALSKDNLTLPSIKALRKMIRETGRKLSFPNIGTTVIGVQNGLIKSSLINS